MEPVVLIVGVVVLLLLLVKVFAGAGITPEDIGNVGEARTARYLRKLPPETYTVFHDLTIADSNGRTTQIDHIVVSPFGVFVIETKCYKGWIFGDEKSRVWTQSLSCGRGWFADTEKHTFQNPIRQNWRHIYVLAERLNLPKRIFFNVVVFAGDAEIKTDVPDYVMSEYDVTGYIKSFQSIQLNESTMRRVVSTLERFNQPLREEEKVQHVQMLHVLHAPPPIVDKEEPTPKCPRCGAEMRRRYRRSDGAPFYGCSRYPDCKGIVNIQS